MHLNKAHERGEEARGKSGKNGGEGGGKGGGWVGGGLESSSAPRMASRLAVAWPLSPQGDGGRVTAWRPAIPGAELGL